MDRDQILMLLCSAREHVAKCRTHPHLARHAEAGLKDINGAIEALHAPTIVAVQPAQPPTTTEAPATTSRPGLFNWGKSTGI